MVPVAATLADAAHCVHWQGLSLASAVPWLSRVPRPVAATGRVGATFTANRALVGRSEAGPQGPQGGTAYGTRQGRRREAARRAGRETTRGAARRCRIQFASRARRARRMLYALGASGGRKVRQKQSRSSASQRLGGNHLEGDMLHRATQRRPSQRGSQTSSLCCEVA